MEDASGLRADRHSRPEGDCAYGVQGWTERSVGFLQEHFTLQGRTFTTVAPSSLIRFGPAHRVENLVEKDKNPEEWWPWKLDPRNRDLRQILGLK